MNYSTIRTSAKAALLTDRQKTVHTVRVEGELIKDGRELIN
jgi:hypothetical protein